MGTPPDGQRPEVVEGFFLRILDGRIVDDGGPSWPRRHCGGHIGVVACWSRWEDPG